MGVAPRLRELGEDTPGWTDCLGEPEYPGVYALASVNGHRPPYFWRGRSGREVHEWPVAGRAYIRADRTWVVRLSIGWLPGRAGPGHVTLLQGSWAPASPGCLAVRESGGGAGGWLANGRSLLMRGVVVPGGGREEIVEVTLRYRKWR